MENVRSTQLSLDVCVLHVWSCLYRKYLYSDEESVTLNINEGKRRNKKEKINSNHFSLNKNHWISQTKIA